jgi:hypothetical protein
MSDETDNRRPSRMACLIGASNGMKRTFWPLPKRLSFCFTAKASAVSHVHTVLVAAIHFPDRHAMLVTNALAGLANGCKWYRSRARIGTLPAACSVRMRPMATGRPHSMNPSVRQR